MHVLSKVFGFESASGWLAATHAAIGPTGDQECRPPLSSFARCVNRWGEMRWWAEWTEIDRDEGVWTVPASWTKANREYRVPLSGRALEIPRRGRRAGATVPVRSCSSRSVGNRWTESGCAGCSRSTGSRPCRTGSGRVSGTGRPRRRTIRARSSRPPWRMWSRTGSRRPIGARTCSSGGGGS